jgi:peptide/nickel transport system permease protein
MSTTEFEDATLGERIRENPRPAALWTLGLVFLVALEVGALLTGVLDGLATIIEFFPSGNPGLSAVNAALDVTRSIPTLLTRDLVPNAGHQMPDGRWVGTFPTNVGAESGLEPKHAWLLRLTLIYAYAFAFVGWVWKGYLTYREYYRYADWTPRDDVVRRFRTHRWGQFGFLVVFMFVTMAIFAPAMGPTTIQKDIHEPYDHTTQFYDEDAGEVREVDIGTANLQSASTGGGDKNTGPWQYDQFDRFHPFGTMPTPGQDLFSFMVAGARISLFIGLVAMGIAMVLAASFALLTAYYKGLVDLMVVVTGDSVMSIPQLLLLILMSAVFANHWLSDVYNKGFLLALIFGFTSWPYLWRSVRGPAFQVSEEEWVDAAKSYGQSARNTMKKHMFPYIVGYLLIYGSMSLGGIIIGTSALSFLGLGIDPPTPEWGRAIAAGQSYVATQSWHISFIPGFMIVIVVTAFNALGDGIRDAIDPQADTGEGGDELAAAGGGGG